MNKLTLLAVAFVFAIVAFGCNKEKCCQCTGTVTNTGANADWTVCEKDDNLTRTNNLTQESEPSSNTLAESVAFFESIGLECE